MNVDQVQNLTDEDILNMQVPPVFSEETPAEDIQEESPITPPEEEQPAAEGLKPEGEADAGGAEGDDKEGEKPKGEDLADDQLGEAPAVTEPKTPAASTEVKDAPATDKEKPAEAEKPAADKVEDKPAVDFAAEYAKLVGSPIKANGKEIVLKNTDEVLRLVQQGANYNKRMEELKPARKSAAILESAGLLGNDVALSHMIDLYNGNPQAIAKMIKDLKIDIYSLDLDAGDKYTPVSHLQSDEAVTFQDTLKEVRTLEGGKEAMLLIDSWDQKSKDMIWGNSAAVRQIYDYKQTGIYDTVATEVERRKTLGQIPEGTPFIVAFQAVGEEIAAQAAAANPSTAALPETPVVAEPAKPATRTPVASGPAPVKQEKPDARAAAAASPRGGVGAAKQIPDIYSLSDADIEKMSSPQG